MKGKNQAAAQRAMTSLGETALDHHPLPCHEVDAVLSDDTDERAEAAETLRPDCPIKAACSAAGEFQEFGIWGGIDRTRYAREKRARGEVTT